MDFRQSIQPSANRPAPAPAPMASERKEDKAANKVPKDSPQWLRILTVVLLACVTVVLVGAVVVSLRNSGTNTSNEGKLVDTSKYQAVFLNNGQVYFGYIKDLNSSYIEMTNIFYLTQGGSSSSSSSNSNYSLVKLGCQQIHDPLDQMVINRDQVTFWENLNPSGKVVSSINQFNQQNPHGPDCSQVSSQTQAGSNTSDTQGTATTNNSGTSTDTSGK
jgi:hypothetical protein